MKQITIISEDREGSLADRLQARPAHLARLEQLQEAGRLVLAGPHPAIDSPEMRSIGHKGYEDVAVDRDCVTRVFTSEKVKQVISKKGINLISYKDLK